MRLNLSMLGTVTFGIVAATGHAASAAQEDDVGLDHAALDPLPTLRRCDALIAGERFDTVAHRALAIEHESGVIDAELHERLADKLDAILADACMRLRDADHVDAAGTFTIVDDALAARGYAWRGTLVQYLSEVLQQDDAFANRADCDTQAILYVAFGELTDLPIFMVEVPRHNFARFDDGVTRLNWDPNARKPITDADYERRYGISSRMRGTYLHNMTRHEILAYWRLISSKKVRDELRALEAALGDATPAQTARYEELRALKRLLLERALAQDPRSAAALNDLAWDLLTTPLMSTRDPARALELASLAVVETGVADWPDYVDTLAAAYAATGDFVAAVAWQVRAIAAGDPSVEFECRLSMYRDEKAYEPGTCK